MAALTHDMTAVTKVLDILSSPQQSVGGVVIAEKSMVFNKNDHNTVCYCGPVTQRTCDRKASSSMFTAALFFLLTYTYHLYMFLMFFKKRP